MASRRVVCAALSLSLVMPLLLSLASRNAVFNGAQDPLHMPPPLLTCLQEGRGLGSGSFGTVLGAKCQGTDESARGKLAVKVVDNIRLRKTFAAIDEARILTKVESPFVVKVFSYGLDWAQSDKNLKSFWVVMERVFDGDISVGLGKLFDVSLDNLTSANMSTLARGLSRRGSGGNFRAMKTIEEERVSASAAVKASMRQPEAFAKFIAAVAVSLFRGLEHIHSRHVVHRDIKPDNFLFSNGPECLKGNFEQCGVKLIDFGLACDHELKARRMQKMCKARCGTPTYMSPNMWLEERYTALYSHDIFAAGISLLRMWAYMKDEDTEEYSILQIIGFSQAWHIKKNQDMWKAELANANLPGALLKLLDETLDPDPDKRADASRAHRLSLALWEEAFGVEARPPESFAPEVAITEECSACLDATAEDSKKDHCSEISSMKGAAVASLARRALRAIGCECALSYDSDDD